MWIRGSSERAPLARPAYPIRPQAGWRACARAYGVYWPVVLGTSLAIVLVMAGLTVAVQVLKRPVDVETVALIQPEPAIVPEVLATAPTPIPEPMPPPAPSPAAPAVAAQAIVSEQEENTVEPEVADARVVTQLQQPPACETYGTAVKFMRSPAAAMRQAQGEDKLVFTLHVSGNFEDKQFT